MKMVSKILAGGILFGAYSLASAGPMISISGQGATNAAQAEWNFLATLDSGYLTEDFESFTAASDSSGQSMGLSTSVGNFNVDAVGSGGACNSSGFSCDDGLAVLNAAESPYSGRFSIPAGSSNWLDSMDARELTITPNVGSNAIGFYMTDPNDQGGRFDIDGVGIDFKDIFGSALSNGSQYYISIFDTDAPLGDVSIITNASNDGYGIDKVTVGTVSVPEPGTLALFGLGLAGLGISRKRK